MLQVHWKRIFTHRESGFDLLYSTSTRSLKKYISKVIDSKIIFNNTDNENVLSYTLVEFNFMNISRCEEKREMRNVKLNILFGVNEVYWMFFFFFFLYLFLVVLFIVDRGTVINECKYINRFTKIFILPKWISWRCSI